MASEIEQKSVANLANEVWRIKEDVEVLKELVKSLMREKQDA